MLVIKWIFFVISVFFIFYVLLTENVFGHEHNNYSVICDTFIEKKIPIIKDYAFVHDFRYGMFHYKWYFKTLKPLKVMAVVVRVGVLLTRITWEIDGKIYTVRKKVNEKICVNNIENGYDLTRMYHLLIKQTNSQLDLGNEKTK